MEFDGLKAVAYNVNPGMDYASTGTSTGTGTIATDEKTGLGFPKPTRVEQVQSIKPTSAESIKSELRELKDTISNEFFDKFVQEANKKLFTTGREFSYSLHEGTNRVSIKIIDTKTKEIIREVPPEKALDAAAKMLELVGFMFDEKA